MCVCVCVCVVSLVAQMVKSLPAMRGTWVQSLGREDPLEKGMGTHSSILAWKIPWTEEPRGPQSMSLQRVRHSATSSQESEGPQWPNGSSILWRTVLLCQVLLVGKGRGEL